MLMKSRPLAGAALLACLLKVFTVLAGDVKGQVRVMGEGAKLRDFVLSISDVEGPFPAPAEPAVMDQKDLHFVPHVLPILVGTVVEFPNSDPVAHNVFSISDAKRFNLGLYKRGEIRQVRFEKPGVVELLCNVHLEMSAYIVVLQNPYFAKTDSKGNFQISGVPAGRYRLRCWNERFPMLEWEINVPAEGTVTLELQVGPEDNERRPPSAGGDP